MVYVQHKINNILKHIRAYTFVYIDDIICRAKSLADLLKKLRVLFDIFFYYNIFIKPTKSFLNYLDVGLLGQQINSLGLTTLEKKLKAIKLLTYLKTLSVLEYYLGLTGYLRNYVHYYTQLVALLQALKIFLLQDALING